MYSASCTAQNYGQFLESGVSELVSGYYVLASVCYHCSSSANGRQLSAEFQLMVYFGFDRPYRNNAVQRDWAIFISLCFEIYIFYDPSTQIWVVKVNENGILWASKSSVVKVQTKLNVNRS